MGKIIKREKSLTMTMLMTPDKANFSGKYVHGGEILKMLD
ncbi:acyl-CoA thioesterase, partial [Aliarcobacter butzleri]|nr:acyl-CoA thioesterase [Aliarcobacter butzleri]